MIVLRTVIALEHEIVPVLDTLPLEGSPDAAIAYVLEEDAKALQRLNDVRPGFCQRVPGGIKFAQYCGIVRLPTCTLEVLPKIGMDEARAAGEIMRARGALLTMLHGVQQLAIAKVGTVGQQAVQAPLLDVFIEAFLRCALEQARRGLLYRYVPHRDDLAVVKGRFHGQGHVRRNLSRPHLVHCEFDEFTADNPYNQAVRATLEVCRNWMIREATQHLWFEAQARFAGMTPVRMTSGEVARLPRDRMARRYDSLLLWCEWLLAMNSPAMSAGATHVPGLLFDMNKLFEAHVSSIEEAAAGNGRIVHRQGPVQTLATSDGREAFRLKPDLTVWHVGLDGSAHEIDRVIDAKWKRLDPHADQWGVDQADVYQLLAYALRYRCRRLELVYPAPGLAPVSMEPLEVFRISGSMFADQDIEVRIRAISL